MNDNLLRHAWMEVNLINFDENLKAIQARIGQNCQVIGIVKADAYGHGSIECSRVMLKNGVKCLAVATLGEALELRMAGIMAPIILLGIVPAIYADVVVRNSIIPIISDYKNASDFSKEAYKQGVKLELLIAIETGMGRIGFSGSNESVDEIKKVTQLPNTELFGVMSHFSSADLPDLEYSYYQLKNFNHMVEMLEASGVSIPIRSMSNSPAMYRLPESYFEAVRPGAMLWGFYPNCIDNPNDIPLLPVMAIKAKIAFIKRVPAGTAISYGRKFVTQRESLIGTLPIGYADGMTRMLQGDKVRTIVRGCFARIVGTICMDQCMIDLTDIPEAEVGDEVVLLGKQGNNEITTQELTNISGLCCGELWYNFSKRLPRIFIE